MKILMSVEYILKQERNRRLDILDIKAYILIQNGG